jgi:hypothetical protein
MVQILRSGGVVCALAVALIACPVLAQSTIDPLHVHAWSPNTGWIDWRADGANGARVGEYTCSGYLYAANVGWIHLGNGRPLNGIRYQNSSAADFGVNRDPMGELSGLAYGANVGWVVFTNRAANGVSIASPRVDPRTGRFAGFVYGANVGWISLSNAMAFVQTGPLAPGADDDRDGLPDAWELDWAGNLTLLAATADLDEDGATDGEEYGADTDPVDPQDLLRIIAFNMEPASGGVRLTWLTKPTRGYLVRQRDSLDPTSPWTDSGLGIVYPTGSSHTVVVPVVGASRLVQIEATR